MEEYNLRHKDDGSGRQQDCWRGLATYPFSSDWGRDTCWHFSSRIVQYCSNRDRIVLVAGYAGAVRWPGRCLGVGQQGPHSKVGLCCNARQDQMLRNIGHNECWVGSANVAKALAAGAPGQEPGFRKSGMQLTCCMAASREGGSTSCCSTVCS